MTGAAASRGRPYRYLDASGDWLCALRLTRRHRVHFVNDFDERLNLIVHVRAAHLADAAIFGGCHQVAGNRDVAQIGNAGRRQRSSLSNIKGPWEGTSLADGAEPGVIRLLMRLGSILSGFTTATRRSPVFCSASNINLAVDSYSVITRLNSSSPVAAYAVPLCPAIRRQPRCSTVQRGHRFLDQGRDAYL